MKEEIRKCLDVLRNGGTILYPTDTIWGIGCDATNLEAVGKVYRIKKRDDAKSMLVLVDSINMLARYVRELPPMALEILEINEDPLTIVYPEGVNLAANLLAEDHSIGIRITYETFSAALIRALGRPLVSTSANLADHPSPENFQAISDVIRQSVDHVVNYGQEDARTKKPSGILKVSMKGEVQILRR